MAHGLRPTLHRPSRVTVVHPHAWAWEPLESEPSFVLRAMFGTKAVYVGGRMIFCFAAKAEPWRGVLVCTDHTHHPSLQHDFPNLQPHPILPKWLYLPEAAPRFESTVRRLVELVRQRDGRIGIEPKVRQRRRKTRAPRGRGDRP